MRGNLEKRLLEVERRLIQTDGSKVLDLLTRAASDPAARHQLERVATGPAWPPRAGRMNEVAAVYLAALNDRDAGFPAEESEVLQ